jgi:hypothetical protein
MRLIYFLFLVAFAGAVGVFAYQNQHEITLTFLNWQITASVALVAGVIYALGMLSGWTVVGMIRRSFRRVTAEADQEYAHR